MWEELYEKYRPELVRYCAVICRDGSAAEDLVQETFLKAIAGKDKSGFWSIGREALAPCEAMLQSASSGKPVKVKYHKESK